MADFVEDPNCQFAADPTKTIFQIKGISGFKVAELLDKDRINVEKSTFKCNVVTCHINIIEEDVDTLIDSVRKIAMTHGSETDDLVTDTQQL